MNRIARGILAATMLGFALLHPALFPPASADSDLGTIDLDKFCRDKYQAGGVFLRGNDAYSWMCRTRTSPNWNYIDMNEACQKQYGDPQAYAKTDNVSDKYSWRCYTSGANLDPAILLDLHSHFSDDDVNLIVLALRYAIDAPRCAISLNKGFVDGIACGPAAQDVAQIAGLWLDPKPVGQPQPAAPTNLRATANGRNSIQLTWDDNSDNETGFNIRDGNTWVGKTDANARSYTVRGLSPGSYHCYRVEAFNGSEISDSSNWACMTTAP